MTTTRPAKQPVTKPEPTTTGGVTVHVRHHTAVYFDGDQRGGTIHGVDPATAAYWVKRGWVDAETTTE